MPVKDKATLKGYFNDGDLPVESNYIDLIDSMGEGDMLKSTYDPNNDGKVNSAVAADTASDSDKVDGLHSSDLGDMKKSVYDPNDDGKVNSAVAADTAADSDKVDGLHLSSLAKLATDEVITGAWDFNREVDMKDNAVPGTPVSGYGRLYINSDKLFFKDDSGLITLLSFLGVRAYQPQIAAFFPNVTYKAVTFNGESYDIGDMHSISTNTDRFIAPVTGYYLVSAQIIYSGGAGELRVARILKGGSTIYGVSYSRNNVSNWVSVEVTAIVNLAVNEYIIIQGYQDSGGALNLEGANLHMARLG